ncbi:Uncharacterized protein APZ42_021517 [Daphnia magna]|uniref:Uncharacterized protein n=1 Tax=Daphnia magna TaxID=35525 RepID=A0A164WLP4_9CRUS|nr:Uncharacterized protein APZ42_021517 [Daphnia magna]
MVEHGGHYFWLVSISFEDDLARFLKT